MNAEEARVIVGNKEFLSSPVTWVPILGKLIEIFTFDYGPLRKALPYLLENTAWYFMIGFIVFGWPARVFPFLPWYFWPIVFIVFIIPAAIAGDVVAFYRRGRGYNGSQRPSILQTSWNSYQAVCFMALGAAVGFWLL